jgi:hypothetical protein
MNFKNYKRFFAFGCSFTQYYWPTWADIISNEFKESHNYGRNGAGNFFIYQSLIEAILQHEINKDDLVMIMFSSVTREDRFTKNRGWITPGNLYFQNEYDEKFIKNYMCDHGYLMRDLNLDSKKYAPRAFQAAISNAKNELMGPADFRDATNNYFEEVVAEVYALYQKRLSSANAMDFDDLIMKTVELFQRFPDVRERYRNRFKHILVDEYQDTNRAQYFLIRELVGDLIEGTLPAQLCVVGDADQSIYGFRGATIRNILQFEEDSRLKRPFFYHMGLLLEFQKLFSTD